MIHFIKSHFLVPLLVLFLVGPTGIGKTTLSNSIADYLPVEIISADSRQIFKQLDVGTAKPPKEILDKLNTSVSDGVWKIYDKQKGKKSWSGNSGKVTIHITIPKLTYIGVTGSGNVKSSNFNASSVKLKVTGSGDIEISLKASSEVRQR